MKERVPEKDVCDKRELFHSFHLKSRKKGKEGVNRSEKWKGG